MMKINPASVIEIISSLTGASPKKLLGKRRYYPVMEYRQAIYYLLRCEFGLSYPEIGEIVKRHHSSVLQGCRAANRMYLNSQSFRNLVDQARVIIRSESSDEG